MSKETLSAKTVLAQATEESARLEEMFKVIGRGSPSKPGYYWVKDNHGMQGVAFMYLNRQWKILDSYLSKPLQTWREILP